ncbi:DUF862 domain-containing protein [Besnoitia besnoiti]|uniref:DUF862 domain-containing protein n=1 Tax=Besnoitia besnoiti TaxID=94643 RepID=A0A2A9ML90_BESBE|nr:DUF862 domain-containing protein [Besnoitia besnoiti]PFH36453.1 DUF862 domain-containing protein [Besnoitia besnoiti]
MPRAERAGVGTRPPASPGSGERQPRHAVRLKVFDLSKGMAKIYGGLFISDEKKGVWHTNVEVFGLEYFYMSTICICRSGMGWPGEQQLTDRIDLGTTERTPLEVEAFLRTQQQIFTPDKYDMFKHNCNHFSNLLLRFLNSRMRVPSYILSLPDRVLQTTLGKLLHPFLMAAMDCMKADLRRNADKAELSGEIFFYGGVEPLLDPNDGPTRRFLKQVAREVQRERRTTREKKASSPPPRLLEGAVKGRPAAVVSESSSSLLSPSSPLRCFSSRSSSSRTHSEWPHGADFAGLVRTLQRAPGLVAAVSEASLFHSEDRRPSGGERSFATSFAQTRREREARSADESVLQREGRQSSSAYRWHDGTDELCAASGLAAFLPLPERPSQSEESGERVTWARKADAFAAVAQDGAPAGFARGPVSAQHFSSRAGRCGGVVTAAAEGQREDLDLFRDVADEEEVGRGSHGALSGLSPSRCADSVAQAGRATAHMRQAPPSPVNAPPVRLPRAHDPVSAFAPAPEGDSPPDAASEETSEMWWGCEEEREGGARSTGRQVLSAGEAAERQRGAEADSDAQSEIHRPPRSRSLADDCLIVTEEGRPRWGRAEDWREGREESLRRWSEDVDEDVSHLASGSEGDRRFLGAGSDVESERALTGSSRDQQPTKYLAHKGAGSRSSRNASNQGADTLGWRLSPPPSSRSTHAPSPFVSSSSSSSSVVPYSGTSAPGPWRLHARAQSGEILVVTSPEAAAQRDAWGPEDARDVAEAEERPAVAEEDEGWGLAPQAADPSNRFYFDACGGGSGFAGGAPLDEAESASLLLTSSASDREDEEENEEQDECLQSLRERAGSRFYAETVDGERERGQSFRRGSRGGSRSMSSWASRNKQLSCPLGDAGGEGETGPPESKREEPVDVFAFHEDEAPRNDRADQARRDVLDRRKEEQNLEAEFERLHSSFFTLPSGPESSRSESAAEDVFAGGPSHSDAFCSPSPQRPSGFHSPPSDHYGTALSSPTRSFSFSRRKALRQSSSRSESWYSAMTVTPMRLQSSERTRLRTAALYLGVRQIYEYICILYLVAVSARLIVADNVNP